MLPEVSEGAAAIFQTLKGINDLVRLSALLNIDFPFDEYSSVANLPVICVEFAHLEEKTGGTGTLTLLDTPGPNEAGQDRLRPMLKEQLSKASAVLAVMDYTQLKSEADAQVRADLLEIAEVARGRLYALVNKFDQSDRNGMKADAVKQFVQELMSSTQGPVLQAEQVFPVSSRYAYLANRARHEVARHGSLPVPAHGTWVEDFGELAFGRLWESKIEDAQKVQKAAAALWNDSLFDAPLSGVIQMAHANAAVLAVDAASAKLLDYATKMSNQCTARETALLMEAKNLRELVQGLQDDIERIGKCEQAAKDSQEEQVKNFTAALDLHFGNLTQEVKDQLETYFQRGKHDEKARNFKRRQDEKDQEDLRAERNPIYRLRRALQRDFGHGGAEQMHPADPLSDFDPSNPVIKFETDQKAAQALLTKIEASVGSIFGKAGKGIEASLDAGLQEFEASFQEDVVEKARDVLDAVLRRLEKDGLGALQLELPQQRGMALHLSGQQMLAEALETRTVNRTRLVHQSGFWGGVKRTFDFFGNEWGQDRRSYQEEHYDVDLSKIREKVLASADASFKGLHAAVASQVKAPLARAVDQFFEAFRGHVEVVRGDLLRGLSDKSEEESQQRLILNGLRDLQKDLPGQRQDAEKLKAEISGVLVQQQVTG
ncbi:dynamin family protein [Sphaerotilus sulfidivorans]